MLTVACVLKSGGDYKWDYVERLYKGVKENLSYDHDFRFVCFTDNCSTGVNRNIQQQRHLFPSLESYWSKLEVFGLKGQVIYFDLDVIITRSIDELARMILYSKRSDKVFYMMKAFNKRRAFNSSIMAWNGDFSYLLSELKPDHLICYRKWDQRYISETLEGKDVSILSVDNYLNIKSYRHHCIDGIPEGTDVVVFHGLPRPREVQWLEGELCQK